MPDVQELDTAVAERMGHPGALRATAFDSRGLPIEMALLGPREHADEHAVTIHYDCDPDEPTRGSSELHPYATLAEAEAGYEEEFARLSAELARTPSP